MSQKPTGQVENMRMNDVVTAAPKLPFESVTERDLSDAWPKRDDVAAEADQFI
jgi:hypothetical protein